MFEKFIYHDDSMLLLVNKAPRNWKISVKALSKQLRILTIITKQLIAIIIVIFVNVNVND